jgi:hypothetical protein
MGARDAGAAFRVIGVRAVPVRAVAFRAANLIGCYNGSRQDGAQSGSQFSRRVQATSDDGWWLTQEHDRHRNGDPPEHACSRHAGPRRVRICSRLVRI